MSTIKLRSTPTLKQDVKMILEAIEAVKSQINKEESKENKIELMGNLVALENCLVTQVTELLEAI